MNSQDYIKVPYLSNGRTNAGWDCWGLVCAYYERELGITVPSYQGAYSDAAEREEVSRLIAGLRSTWVQVSEPALHDLVLCRLLRVPSHVGVYVGEGYMLHARAGSNTCLERLALPFWRTRVEGYFRYDRQG